MASKRKQEKLCLLRDETPRFLDKQSATGEGKILLDTLLTAGNSKVANDGSRRNLERSLLPDVSRVPGKFSCLKKHRVRVGTWNVRTMMEQGKLENLKREMTRLKMNMLGISEARWRGNGNFMSDEYQVIYAGGEECQRGVALILHKEIARRVKKIVQHSDRLLLVKIEAEPIDMTVIQTYMPTSAHSDEEVEDMYEEIERLLDEEEARDNVVIMGYWNAIVGEGRDDIVVGEYGMGRRNKRGDKLVEFCKQRKLVVTNTWFKQNKRRIYTWKKPGDSERYQLDYILVKQRYRNSIKNSHSYPGADANTDHNLVMMEMDLRLKRIMKIQAKKKWDVERLKINAQQYREDALHMLEQRSVEGLTVEEHWKIIKEAVTTSAKTHAGYTLRRKAKKPWVTDLMLNKMDERRRWKNVNTAEGLVKYKQLHKELRNETKRAREHWWAEKCEELMDMDRKGRSDLMYAAIKSVKKGKRTTRGGAVLRDREGRMLTTDEEIRERWVEYVEELYDKDGKPELVDLATEAEDLVGVDAKGPGLLVEEVVAAIEEMKVKKAEGIDGIPAELWKALGKKGSWEVTKLCMKMYDQGIWPKEFTQSIVIPIPKKQNAMDCSDYRTISLIPHCSKILLKILTKRIENKAKDYISQTQFGFRNGLGTRDAVGVMRMLCQRVLEHDGIVFVCFVDFEKAFDRVNWVKLMSVLKDIGVDWKDRNLIVDLYIQQEAVIRIGAELTGAAKIGRGVRQGCLLSPLLFSIYIESLMKEAMEGSEDGIKVGGQVLQDVRFADDQAMVDSSEEGLQRTMFRLVQTAMRYDMKINAKKTKVMRVSRKGGGTVKIIIDGQQVEQVQHFQYLGTWISDDGRCEREIKARIGIAKETFRNHKELLTRNFSKTLKRKIVKTVIWTTVLYGAECWTLKKEEVRKLEAFEMWVWRRMEKIRWKDKITNKKVLELVGESRSLVETVIKRKKKWIGHVVRGCGVMKVVIEGRMEGKRPRGRKRKGMLDELLEEQPYEKLKRMAEDREYWRRWMPRTCLLAEHS